MSGIKFFEKSKCLLADGAQILSVTSGTSSANYMIDRNPASFWRSTGSSDAVTEEIEIEFDTDMEINRLFLVDHNWKSYTAQYWNGAAYANFSTTISESTFAYDTSYHAFNTVTTNKIKITVTTTQTANQQKYLCQAIVTKELGTMNGYPKVNGLTVSKNSRVQKMLSGKVAVQKSEESASFTLSFETYPTYSSEFKADLDLMFDLFEMDDAFIVWLCGGQFDNSMFGYRLRGFRLKDVLTVQIVDDISQSYMDNVYINPVSFEVRFVESV